MPSPTPHLGLNNWSTSDTFSTAELDANFSKLDAAPGVTLCTSSTRPSTWSAAQQGMLIYETDSGLTWIWSGTAFVRYSMTGLIGQSVTTAPISTSSTWTPPSGGGLVVVTSVVASIPAGGRQVMIVASVPSIANGSNDAYVAITKNGTSLSWRQVTTPDDGDMIVFDTPGSTTVTYAVCVACTVSGAGTVVVTGSADQPVQLSVVEV